MEFNNTDAKNIIGFADLMCANNDSINPLKMEEEIINGMNAILEEEEDQVNQYKQEMERMVNDFNIDDFNQSDEINTGGNEVGINKSDVHELFNDNNVGDSIKDTQLQYMTLEQGRQNFVDDVLHDIGVEDNNMEFNIDKEEEEDDKNALLEQIDMLKDSLEDDGVSLINIPPVSKSNTMSEIQNVYKILRIKNDRNRYCSFAEEVILSGAHGLEYLFDGKNEWFGRKPDLVGWSNTVRIKLRRCRFQTSTLIKDIMQDYNMGSGWQLLLELIPSMFLYSRQKKIAANDDQYDDAISQINSTME